MVTQKDQVRATLDGINEAWRQESFGVLGAMVDEDIVMKGPGLKQLTKGREAFVESYKQFMAQSKVIEYRESNHVIDIWEDTAAATYDWTMTYEQKGETKSDKGQDMFVFRREKQIWRPVLRLILF